MSMKKEDIELFDKAIHDVKRIVGNVKQEKDEFRKKLRELKIEFNKKTNSHIKELLNVVDELYELFEDLQNDNGK